MLYRTLNQLQWLDIREWNTVTICTQVYVLQTLSAPKNAQFCILCVCSVRKVVYLLMLLQFVNQVIMHAVSIMKVASCRLSCEYSTTYRIFLLSLYRSRRFIIQVFICRNSTLQVLSDKKRIFLATAIRRNKIYCFR